MKILTLKIDGGPDEVEGDNEDILQEDEETDDENWSETEELDDDE
jgi:hypothetical protein